MLDSQKYALRRSEIRERLNELQQVDSLSEDLKAEMRKLSTEYQEVEVRWRAAVAVEDQDETDTTDTTDSESAELHRMETRANVGRYFGAVLDHRQVDGVEAELQQHFNLGGNQLPISMLMERRQVERNLETRAVTPAPTNVQGTQNRIIPAVFPASAAAFLGIPQPTVGIGEQVYPVLTTSATVNTPAKNAESTETTGAFSSDKLTPQRLQASFFWAREDAATFQGMGEALRANLREALSDKLDEYILSDGTVGLLGGGIDAPTDPTDTATWAGYKSDIASIVDGRYASSESDVRVVFGGSTWAHMRSLYRGTQNGTDDDAVTALRNMGTSVRVSAHVPDAATNVQGAIAAIGSAQHSVAPVWSGVSLIPDEITLADKGQVKLSAFMLAQFKVLRGDGFERLSYKIA